jgi:multicomponent Na+:H+ antiporter subunit B
MTRRARVALFGVGATLLGVMLIFSFTGLPRFGTSHHPYADRAVQAAVQQRQTANVVSSVNFDQRAVDTLGEQLILFAALAGTLVILREMRDEKERPETQGDDSGQVLPATSLVAYVFLTLATLVGVYVVAHGHVSPGGGFQGGVILGTAIHFLYVGGGYGAIRRARPASVYELGEALGAGGFVVLGLAGTAVTGSLLANMLSHGSLAQLLSGGTVEIYSALVGLEVSSAMIVLLSRFLEQHAEVSQR